MTHAAGYRTSQKLTFQVSRSDETLQGEVGLQLTGHEKQAWKSTVRGSFLKPAESFDPKAPSFAGPMCTLQVSLRWSMTRLAHALFGEASPKFPYPTATRPTTATPHGPPDADRAVGRVRRTMRTAWSTSPSTSNRSIDTDYQVQWRRVQKAH